MRGGDHEWSDQFVSISNPRYVLVQAFFWNWNSRVYLGIEWVRLYLQGSVLVEALLVPNLMVKINNTSIIPGLQIIKTKKQIYQTDSPKTTQTFKKDKNMFRLTEESKICHIFNATRIMGDLSLFQAPTWFFLEWEILWIITTIRPDKVLYSSSSISNSAHKKRIMDK